MKRWIPAVAAFPMARGLGARAASPADAGITVPDAKISKQKTSGYVGNDEYNTFQAVDVDLALARVNTGACA